MLTAKLFAALAILQVGMALLLPHASIDLLFHATYFVVGRFYWLNSFALSSFCFSLIYLAASRWVLRPLKTSLGLQPSPEDIALVGGQDGLAALSKSRSRQKALLQGKPGEYGRVGHQQQADASARETMNPNTEPFP